MTIDIDIQLNNLSNLLKNKDILSKDDRIGLLNDSKGWTNIYIADLIGINTPEIMERANKKNIEILEQTPNIQPIIDKLTATHEVDSMILDLKHGYLKLISGDVSVYINPQFILYFYKTYKDILFSFKIIISEDRYSPVKIVSNDNETLIGLIMPVRID